MPILKKRRRRQQSRRSAKINLKNSKNSCITVEALASLRIQTTVTS
jgi:hypothetical protein|tara:strand:- start:332 stop:469 length:138 start_codon:yes stop_codon:yes gene_type:complete